MSAVVVLVQGTVRTVEDKVKDGKRWGRIVNVLTEVGAVLGDTVEVTVFEPRDGEPSIVVSHGEHIVWVVEVESTKWGLRARYRGEGGSAPAFAPSSPAVDAWLSGATSETAPAA